MFAAKHLPCLTVRDAAIYTPMGIERPKERPVPIAISHKQGPRRNSGTALRKNQIIFSMLQTKALNPNCGLSSSIDFNISNSPSTDVSGTIDK